MRRDEDGVSVVVGAVLVLGIVITLLVTVTLEWAPAWESNAEAAHAVGVHTQISALHSQISLQTSNRTLGDISSPITLGQGRSSMMAGSGLPGALEFRPLTNNIVLSSTQLLVMENNGTFLSPGNQWVAFPASTTLQDIADLQALRLRIADLSAAKCGRSVTVTLTDAAGVFMGSHKATVSVPSAPGCAGPPSAGVDFVVTNDVRDRTNVVINSVPTYYPTTSHFTPFYVNALGSGYSFDQVVASASKPMRVTIAYDAGFDTDYAMSWRQVDASGASLQKATGGQVRTPYQETMPGGAMRLVVRNSRFPAQTYVMENGALIVDQADGAVLRAPPSFSAFKMGADTSVTLQLPSLSGDLRQLSGDQVATVTTRALSHERFVASAPRLNLTIATSYPTIWASFIDTQLRVANLSPAGATPEYRVTPGVGSVRLDLFGSDANPASATRDVTLTLVQANIEVSVKS
jgi:hypothetical protein